jgi:hypothetical protein
VLEEPRLTVRFVLLDVVSLVGMAAEAGLQAQALFGDTTSRRTRRARAHSSLRCLGARERRGDGPARPSVTRAWWRKSGSWSRRSITS